MFDEQQTGTEDDAPDVNYSKYPLVTDPTREILNNLQLEDWKIHREQFTEDLATKAKDPKRNEGYADETVVNSLRRTDRFARWCWTEKTDGYSIPLQTQHADEFLDKLLEQGVNTGDDKEKYRQYLLHYFDWLHRERNGDEWDPDVSFKQGRDRDLGEYFRRDERHEIRQAALEYGTVPGYNDLSPEDRDQWRAHLAERFGKPKADVTPEDWDKANGWKIPSLVFVSLDAGLTPADVADSSIHWLDADCKTMRIPADEATKDRMEWPIALSDRTANILQRWLDEREQYDKYADTDTIWLTRESNPYQSHSLSYVIEKLCEYTEINYDNRDLSWYSLRHSTGTLLVSEGSALMAATQLRHSSLESTRKYYHSEPKERTDVLNRI